MNQASGVTCCNTLVDEQAGGRVGYLPTYVGAAPLHTAAQAVWERFGYEVQPGDCTGVFRHFRCLHCLVNVVRRS